MNASNLTAVLDAVKALLESNLIADQSTTAPILAGQDRIQVEQWCPFEDGQFVVVYDSDNDAEAYPRQIQIEDETTLWLSEPIPVNLESARIQKSINGQYLKTILIGSPQNLTHFPCLTINGDVGSIEPLTIGGLSNVIYDLTISVWAEAPDCDTANRNAWAIAREVEATLTNQINPDPNNCSIWFSELQAARQDQLVNANSTLKVIHLPYSVHETVQRFIADLPVHLQMAQDQSP